MSRPLQGALGLAFAAIAACGSNETGPDRATSVWVVGLPISIDAGVPFTLTAELRDEQANVTGATGTVALALVGNADVDFSGPRTVRAVSGVATFADLKIDRASSGLRFVATSGALSGSSATFSVRTGAASASASGMTPTAGNVPTAMPTLMAVSVRDAAGNPVGGATVTMSSTLSGATFSPSSGSSSPAGVFTTSFRPNSAGSVSVTATVNGTPIPESAALAAVDLCTASPMTFPGSTEGATPCGNYVSSAYAPTQFAFSSAGGAMAFAVAAAFTPIVSLSAQAGSNDLLFIADHIAPAAEWLLPAGDFTFNVATGDFAGRFVVTGTSVVPDVHPGIRVLASTGTYTGQALTGSDFSVAFAKRGDRYLFRTNGSCTVTLRSNAFAPELLVSDFVTGATLAFVQQPVGVDAVAQLPNCRGAGTNPILIRVSYVAAVPEFQAYTLILEQPPALRTAAVMFPIDMGPPIPISALLDSTSPRRR